MEEMESKNGKSHMTTGLFSSRSDEWETPPSLFSKLDEEFHFTIDVCANSQNRKCDCFYSKEEDGLKQIWKGVCWMNPPYGRVIGQWVEKAYRSTLETASAVVCLLPARTDMAWWHDYVIPHSAEIRFLRGRIRFSNAKAGAPFPSAIVVFKSQKNTQGEKIS